MGIQAALAIQGVGAIMSMQGATSQASTQRAVLGYESAVARNNAATARYQAQQELVIGAQQEQAVRLRTAQLKGAQRTSMAANGIDLGEGTATDVLTSTEFMGEHDALTIRDNAARKEWAYLNQAQNYDSTANTDAAMASAINPTRAGLGSLLGSAGAMASTWFAYNKAGGFGGAGAGSSSSIPDSYWS